MTEGYFYESVEEAVKYGKAIEVEKEIRAQIERALSYGIKPTHLDPHMETLIWFTGFFQNIFEDWKGI